MKSKFADIVKIRKRKVDELHDALARIEFQMNQLRITIEELLYALNHEEIPMSGMINELLALQEVKRAYKIEIENKRAYLSNLVQSKHNIIEALKIANMDYEKMKYLHESELEQHRIALKQKEAKNLDEIAVMLYNNRDIV
jgi:flagellar export protein FliJ